MPEIQYKITTAAELAGAQAAAESLERQIGKAKALKQDYSELQKQLDAVNQSIRESQVPQEKSNEQMEAAGGHARSLHSALHLIARESGPAVGAAFAAATALMTGGLFAAILAVRELFDWIGSLQQKAEAFRESQALLWLAAKDGAHSAAVAAQEFNDKLDDEAEKTETLKTKFGDQIKLLNTQLAAHKQILEAIEKEELAAAAGDKDKEDAIKKRFDRLKSDNDLEGERQRIALEHRQLGELEQAKFHDDLAARELEKTKEQLVAQTSPLKAAQDNLTKKFGSPEELKAEADQADALVKKGLATGAMKELPHGGLEITDLAKFSATENYDLTRLGGATGIRKAQKNWADYQASQDAIDANDAAVKENSRGLVKAEAAGASDAGSISALTASIAELIAELKIKSSTNATIGMLQSSVGNGETVASAGAKIGFTNDQLVTLINRILENHGNLVNVVAALQARQDYNERITKDLASRQQSHLTP